MKDEETNYRPHSGSDPSGISYAENARRDGITKGARTTAIISVLILFGSRCCCLAFVQQVPG